ncbi:MAG: hypothetical protein MZV63_65550 [Marinilabiliales bacterium]|nr:hypothetical protein [Marinilabiliales bacterium]
MPAAWRRPAGSAKNSDFRTFETPVRGARWRPSRRPSGRPVSTSASEDDHERPHQEAQDADARGQADDQRRAGPAPDRVLQAPRDAPACRRPMQRALAFKHIMEDKTVVFNDGELIVGERGPAPKATPTYPEVCIHSVQDLAVPRRRARRPPSPPTTRPAASTPTRSSRSGRAAPSGTGSSPR